MKQANLWMMTALAGRDDMAELLAEAEAEHPGKEDDGSGSPELTEVAPARHKSPLGPNYSTW